MATIANQKTALLAVKDVCVEFRTRDGMVDVLRQVNFALHPGEILGLVGESGSGKSMTSLAIMGLVPKPGGRVKSGQVLYRGEDLVQASDTRLRQIRGARIAMVFQEPMTALNPIHTIGRQIVETLLLHSAFTKIEARQRSIDLLREVGISSPEQRVDEYPHQLSGGMRQRAMIAMALACEPDILIADEPTTALDVTVQAQIFDLLRDLQQRKGTAILLITHDMGVIAEMCDRVAVMYAGTIVEQGTTAEVLEAPMHPYTRGLINCLPESRLSDADWLAEIPGVVPALSSLGAECAFKERCEFQTAACDRSPDLSVALSSVPLMSSVAGDPRPFARLVACHHPLLASPSSVVSAP